MSSAANGTDRDNVTCPTTRPKFHDYMLSLSTEYVITFGVLGCVTLLLTINYLEELMYLQRQRSSTMFPDKAKWLLALYPLVALTAFLSLVAPRTSGLNNLVAAIYVAVCVYIFVMMLIEQFGGPGGMMRTLHGNPVRLNAPPFCFCCCCCCCHHRPFRRLSVQVLCTMIMQFVLVRPFLGYIVSIIWTDGGFGFVTVSATNAAVAGQYLSFVYTASTLMAIWSFAIVFDLCKVPLQSIHIRPKFFCLQLVLFVTGVQRSIVEIFVLTGIIVCEPPLLPAEVVADRWNSMIEIGEMVLLASVARIFYRHTIRVHKQQLATASRHAADPAAAAASVAATINPVTDGPPNNAAALRADLDVPQKLPYHAVFFDDDVTNDDDDRSGNCSESAVDIMNMNEALTMVVSTEELVEKELK